MDDMYNEALSLRKEHEGKNVTLSYDEPLLLLKGSGTELFDEDQRYLDTVNNVAIVGHVHPKVVHAQLAQLLKLNTNSRYLCSVHSKYIAALADTFPEPLKVCYLVNSGSEANDLALQIATAARPGADYVAVMEGAYHGHVASMMRLSPYKFWGPGGCGRPSGVHVLPLPDIYRQRHLCGKKAARAVIQQVEAEGGRLAAFFCESVLSCAGQVMLPSNYLADVYTEMQQHGAVCVADEVQCGFGRLGDTFWGFQAHGVTPDIVVCGKAMGNGYPLAGLVTTKAIAASYASGPAYFNTFGGNNVACASGLSVLQVLAEEGLQENSRIVGGYLHDLLCSIMKDFPDVIGDVRGRGLFIGVEIVECAMSKVACPGKAVWIKEHMKGLRVLMSTDGIFGNVLKIKPPLVFTCDNADELASKLRLACCAAASHACAIDNLNVSLLPRFLPGQDASHKYMAELTSICED